MTYHEAVELLGKRDAKRVANNTYLERREDGSIALRLHSTDVLTFHVLDGQGTVTVRTGGWHSAVTRDRINANLPGDWSIGIRRDEWLWFRNGERVADFSEGDTLVEHPTRKGIYPGIVPDCIMQELAR